MGRFYVCEKDCTYAGQRWYPGDKMPVNYAKDGKCPPHFTTEKEYLATAHAAETAAEVKRKAEKKELERKGWLFNTENS